MKNCVQWSFSNSELDEAVLVNAVKNMVFLSEIPGLRHRKIIKCLLTLPISQFSLTDKFVYPTREVKKMIYL